MKFGVKFAVLLLLYSLLLVKLR